MIIIEDHIETYLDKMVEAIKLDPLLIGHPLTTIETTCRVLAYRMRPIVDILEESHPRYVFRIVSPPLASYIGGCLGNDTNSDRHTGQAAIVQSNAIIGICTDAVMRSLKGSLIKVKPLNFRSPIPFGKPVIVTIIENLRSKLTFGTIEIVTECGKAVMRAADLEMSSS